MRLQKLAAYLTTHECPIRYAGGTTHIGKPGRCPACERQMSIAVIYVEEDAGTVRYSGRKAVEKYIERPSAKRIREEFLVRTMAELLAAHGLPTHWELIAEMVIDSSPHVRVSRKDIYQLLRRRKDVFVALRPGVYGLVD